jgi:hypothetical protein
MSCLRTRHLQPRVYDKRRCYITALDAKQTERKKSTSRKAPPATTTYEHLLDSKSKGISAQAYERYLQLPVPVVLASLWQVGTLSMALCVGVLPALAIVVVESSEDLGFSC